MASLAQLKIRRKTLRGALTRFNTFLNEIDQTNVDIDSIKVYKARVEGSLDEFIDVQERIEALDKEEEKVDAIGEFETLYLKLTVFANSLIRDNTKDISNIHNSGAGLRDTELPKIEIPKFAGEFDKWLPFYNTFKSMVHERNDLSSTQKYHHLISSLKGEAADLIAHSEVCPSSYDEAWSALINAYNNRRKLVQQHIGAIFDYPSITKECPEQLLKIVRGVAKHVRSLKVLDRPIDSWDDILVHVVRNKIDPITRREWDRSLSKDEFPSFTKLCEFIEDKCHSVDYASFTSCKETQRASTHIIAETSCNYCKGPHFIAKCSDFKLLSNADKYNLIKNAKLCSKCLKRANHPISKCFGSNCLKCKKPHHTLLHRDVEQPNSTVALSYESSVGQALLTTAVVNVKSEFDKLMEGRVLLDNGSQSNFITREFANKIGAKLDRESIMFESINKVQSVVESKTTIEIKSRINSFSTSLDCYVIENITGFVPRSPYNTSCLNLPKNIQLADPKFDIPRPVDILIGSSVFWKILLVGRLDRPMQLPTIQKTLFGWVVGGGAISNNIPHTMCNLNTRDDISSFNLEKFWEIESMPDEPKSNYTETDIFFKNTVKRNVNGRFTVRLPFQKLETLLGRSKHLALKRFYNLERKFTKDPELKINYINFMREYRVLGHMQEVQEPDERKQHYYMPHHGVIKDESVTTKLRVVFDASAKTDNGHSLNDILLKGPVLQDNLINILLRFRFYKYILAADITKMYRQILVDPSDRKFQSIIWRENKTEPLQIYELNTLTYGTAPASYLAVRCLMYLADEYKLEYPEASAILKRDFYMDDLLTGFHDKSTCIRVRDDIIALLNKGQFKLNKFNSNHSEVLVGLEETNNDPIILLDKYENNKTLGLRWHAQNDILLYNVPEVKSQHCTKRSIVAGAAKLFDPLGLINPIIVSAKIIIQKLWMAKIDWDTPVPENIKNKWEEFCRDLSYLENIRITRCIIYTQNPYLVEIHAFADASQSAYGACVYLKVQNFKGDRFETQLLCAKSRVAPIKDQTIPRLELCAALLLAKLVDTVKLSINITINKFYYYTDSTIVLSWIKGSGEQWKIFVASRIAKIRELSTSENWYYVNTNSNPADIISRGTNVSDLINNKLWWDGPAFLKSETMHNEQPPIIKTENMPDRKKTSIILVTTSSDLDIFNRYSSLSKLKRVLAYCIRFINNTKNKTDKTTGVLTASELKYSTNTLLKLVQSQAFPNEKNNMLTGKPIHNSSKILTLNPFMDNDGIIRVGGRLRNAPVEYNKKYQILLPGDHPFSKLLYNATHVNNLHAGVQTTLASIRQEYWPIAAKNHIKRIIHQCIICFKNKPTSIYPLMGNLPQSRVTIARPFINCGVDYCGPFFIKEGQRKIKVVKAYVAVFVCFVSKAIHLEVVSNLTTDAFLAALRRFISRRGKVLNIYSDNGTNFVGANRELRELYALLKSPNHKNKITSAIAEEGISWHFSPPRSPHFGGIWEAAVKNVKGHLRKVAGEAKLTFEEMYTLISQIEAILNSRPLTPMSNDPTDYTFLTPGHFLIGEAVTSLPCEELMDIKINRLSRWQHVQKMHQHFWQRWSREYLSQLQNRVKWKRVNETQHIGDLVMLRDDNQPPARWVTARIVQLHPGNDGIVRTVSVRTPDGGVTKRATSRVCVLPIESGTEKAA